MKRSLLYVGSYVLTRGFIWASHVYSAIASTPPAFFLVICTLFLYPLQGMIIILVYTNPHVASYRRNHTDESWMRAFWNIVKVGGDLPLSTRRRSSIGRRRSSAAFAFDAHQVQILVANNDSSCDLNDDIEDKQKPALSNTNSPLIKTSLQDEETKISKEI